MSTVIRRSFPLYDDLLEKTKKNPVPVFDVGAICRTINSLKQNHASTIYALIFHDEICNNGKGVGFHVVPYRGKIASVSNGGIIYTFSMLPSRLQYIIALYIEEIRI